MNKNVIVYAAAGGGRGGDGDGDRDRELSQNAADDGSVIDARYPPGEGGREYLMAPPGGGPTRLRDWGYPGHLTGPEFASYERFRDEVRRRGPGPFRSTILSFERAGEREPHALCRWLRARKFVYEDSVRMAEEAAARTAAARAVDFFPDPHAALGVEACVYHSQYPQLYCGYARGGYPLFISKAGAFSAAGLEW